LQKGQILAEMIAQAQSAPHKTHVTVYAAEKLEPRMRGITDIRPPRTAMTLLCSRFQESASDVDPVPGVFMEMLKAL
jgi:hypothetical protein